MLPKTIQRPKSALILILGLGLGLDIPVPLPLLWLGVDVGVGLCRSSYMLAVIPELMPVVAMLNGL